MFIKNDPGTFSLAGTIVPTRLINNLIPDFNHENVQLLLASYVTNITSNRRDESAEEREQNVKREKKGIKKKKGNEGERSFFN